MQIHIEDERNSCLIVGRDIHTTHNLPLPIKADTLLEMILATASTIKDGDVVRIEHDGVTVDKTEKGVRIGRNQSWFDIHWTNILAGIEITEAV